ncbi:MAG TPA: tRNA (N6-threonylcarbamoyladenosine(37)-N6)-methyltransferase TrmO [Dehalococcoidia bacterium]|nr:tRNA (N6-threonylcarbamoyladenosine(37)-N6)-methyltransferase TrmO [Dehalococcoidia bacterium]
MLDRVRRVFSQKAEPFPELPDITLRPIGFVRNGVKEPRPEGWEDVVSRVIIRPELEDALLGLESWSHVLVVFWPHLIPADIRGSKHRLHPRDDPQNPLQGVLATRSQIRFNPVLVTAVRLLAVKGNVLRVKGLDAVDGTPVLDVKPYVARFDSVPEATMPEWVTGGPPSADERK